MGAVHVVMMSTNKGPTVRRLVVWLDPASFGRLIVVTAVPLLTGDTLFWSFKVLN